MLRALLAVATFSLLTVASASAATLTTDRLCYIPGQPMTISGAGWAAESAWGVSGPGVFGSGTADGAGAFAFNTQAPSVPTSPKPRKIRLTGEQDGTQVASGSFKVVSFLVRPKSTNGKPTGKTSWSFSGFAPKGKIFVHVKRGKRSWTQKAGKGDATCGTLKTRMRRLPAVPPKKISYGKYRVFVDNRRKFSKGGLQYRAAITIFKTVK